MCVDMVVGMCQGMGGEAGLTTYCDMDIDMGVAIDVHMDVNMDVGM